MMPPLVAPTEVSTSPWWGVPVIAGAFLVIGALIGFVSNYVLTRHELTREDRRRWDDDILATALAIQEIVRDLHRRSYSEWSKDQEGFRLRAAYLGECARELNQYLPKLRLIASSELVRKAQDLFEIVSAITLIVDESDPRYVTASQLTAAQEAFASQVRKDIRAQR